MSSSLPTNPGALVAVEVPYCCLAFTPLRAASRSRLPATARDERWSIRSSTRRARASTGEKAAKRGVNRGFRRLQSPSAKQHKCTDRIPGRRAYRSACVRHAGNVAAFSSPHAQIYQNSRASIYV